MLIMNCAMAVVAVAGVADAPNLAFPVTVLLGDTENFPAPCRCIHPKQKAGLMVGFLLVIAVWITVLQPYRYRCRGPEGMSGQSLLDGLSQTVLSPIYGRHYSSGEADGLP